MIAARLPFHSNELRFSEPFYEDATQTRFLLDGLTVLLQNKHIPVWPLKDTADQTVVSV